ncbi:MAG: response regulator transcription factor [Bacteroidales bacterium]|nr:response regulator transcription factor [Bacteroidales bacterium]
MKTKNEIQLLYVEDDESLAFLTKDKLEQKGYVVTHAINGVEGLRKFNESAFNVCIIDVMMPEMDGFTLAAEIRKRNQQVPIIFLTAKTLTEDKIAGLELGADDYITKPFSIKELMLRVEVFLKRSMVTVEDKSVVFERENVLFDQNNLVLTVNGTDKKLTHREAELLSFLIKNSNQVIKRDKILMEVWGDDDYFLGRSLDVFISRLRKMLKEQSALEIENIHGIGFKLKIKAVP